MKRATLIVVVTLCMMSFSKARIVTAPNVEHLIANSDLVAVGKVIDVKDAGDGQYVSAGQTLYGRWQVATLSLRRILKGTFSEATVRFKTFIERSGLYDFPSPGEIHIFFMRRELPGEYVPTEPDNPYLIASVDSPPMTGSLESRVVGEIAFVLKSSKSTPVERRQAVDTLAMIRTKRATAALAFAAIDDTIEDIRLVALAALLRRNEITLLDRAEEILRSVPPGEQPYPVAGLAVALQSIKDPKAIPVLAALASAPNEHVRENSVAALSQIGTQDAVEPLLKALNDKNQEVRFYAASGLAQVTGQTDWWVGPETYKAKEEYYLTHWREWAKSR